MKKGTNGNISNIGRHCDGGECENELRTMINSIFDNEQQNYQRSLCTRIVGLTMFVFLCLSIVFIVVQSYWDDLCLRKNIRKVENRTILAFANVHHKIDVQKNETDVALKEMDVIFFRTLKNITDLINDVTKNQSLFREEYEQDRIDNSGNNEEIKDLKRNLASFAEKLEKKQDKTTKKKK